MPQDVSCAKPGFQERFRMRQIIDKRAAPNSVWCRDVILMLSIAGSIAITETSGIKAEETAINPESRQFDFWLGDWAIANPSGSTDATSRVYLALGQYLLVESWDDGNGHKGEYSKK